MIHKNGSGDPSSSANEAPLRHTLLFALVLTALHSLAWYIAGHREGSWSQSLEPDQSANFRSALLIHRALAEHGILGFLDAWVHHDSAHTPFVPAVGAIWMCVFGETRGAAEIVLPCAMFLFFVSVASAVGRVYGRTTGWAAAALASCFPIFIVYSRTLLFEFPLAAMLAAANWALLATERFQSTTASIRFGVVAGLTCLTRGGAPIFIIGPTLAALIAAMRMPAPSARMFRCGVSTLIAASIAATWYLPNWSTFSAYVWRQTYGDDATYRMEGSRSFSWSSLQHYAVTNLSDGPGIWIVAFAVLALFIRAWKLRRSQASIGTMFSPFITATIFVYGLTFLFLLAGAQRERARFFQPVMPIIALWVVRAVACVPLTWARRILALGTASVAAAHLVFLTFFFHVPPPAGDPRDSLRDFYWFPEETYYTHLLNLNGIDRPNADYRISDVVDVLEDLRLQDDSRVDILQIMSPFFQQNGLLLESERRRHRWTLTMASDLAVMDLAVWWRRVQSAAPDVDVYITRQGGPGIAGKFLADELVPSLGDSTHGPFQEVHEPIELGDGSTVRFYMREPRIEPRDKSRISLRPLSNPWPGGTPALRITGAGVSSNFGTPWVRQWFPPRSTSDAAWLRLSIAGIADGAQISPVIVRATDADGAPIGAPLGRLESTPAPGAGEMILLIPLDASHVNWDSARGLSVYSAEGDFAAPIWEFNAATNPMRLDAGDVPHVR